MNSTLVAAFGAGIAGAALGGVFVLALAPRPAAPSEEGGAGRALEAHAEELRQLRNALADVMGRVETIEMAPVAPREPAPAPAGADKAAAVSAPVAAGGGDDLRTAVAAVLREEREAERQREEARRAEQRAAQLDRRLDRLATDLGLSAEQKDALRKIFSEDEDRRRELGDRAARGETDWTDPAIREEMRGYVQGRQERIQGLMTPEQYQKYEESPEGRFTRMFAGPGFGGEGALRQLFGGGGPEGGRPRGRRQGQAGQQVQAPAPGNPLGPQ